MRPGKRKKWRNVHDADGGSEREGRAEPTELCPERILGNERRRNCPKPCKQDRDCPNKRQCLCDGQCGLSCVAPGRTCPWPLTPSPNSIVHLLSPAPSFSALLEIRCQPGFTMTNGVFCPPPREVDQGYLVAVQRPEYEVGDAIYYLCKKTFLLDGPNRVNCLPNGTWSTIPFCRGEKLWPYDIPERMVPHGQSVTFYCKHPEKYCSFTSTQTCFDGQLSAPTCYLEPTWLQFKLFPHRLVSEIEQCDPSDLNVTIPHPLF
ncbi:hypothetical protein JZ751_008261 [Albula glossodonta]|uniref:Beta-2-glycoprotein 1 n=1 Tax=Albula glossodonta TaxID=121402 RepID=A0A8T2N1B4_9TELE|nr:hypothetical protein JZ751_008261 [Albula glossodonta]